MYSSFPNALFLHNEDQIAADFSPVRFFSPRSDFFQLHADCKSRASSVSVKSEETMRLTRQYEALCALTVGAGGAGTSLGKLCTNHYLSVQ